MCRWIAYTGTPIFLEDLILKPKYSLVAQSLASRQGAEPTNGDGFGVGWYGASPQPGLYRDTEPAWNDRNLADLARHVQSPMFLAHVRATTGTPIQRTNCHPFRYKDWLMVHNGLVRSYNELRRAMAFEIASDLYPHLEGTTDSELMFFLAITFGLQETPILALERMAGFIERIGQCQGVSCPLQMTLGLADGNRLFAVRYSTEGRSRTLYHNTNLDAFREIHSECLGLPSDAKCIVSEPLSDLSSAWVEIPESSVLTIQDGKVQHQRFTPRDA